MIRLKIYKQSFLLIKKSAYAMITNELNLFFKYFRAVHNIKLPHTAVAIL